MWKVLGRDRDAVTVGLYRCDGGEEADRFVASDPRLAQFLAGRISSQDQPDSMGAPAADPDDHEQRDRDRDPGGRARQARPRDRLGRPLPYGSVGVEPVSEEPLPPLATISVAHDLLAAADPSQPMRCTRRAGKQVPTQSGNFGRGSRSYAWASLMPSGATGSARCASSGELVDDWRPTQPPMGRSTAWTSATSSNGSETANVSQTAPPG